LSRGLLHGDDASTPTAIVRHTSVAMNVR